MPFFFFFNHLVIFQLFATEMQRLVRLKHKWKCLHVWKLQEKKPESEGEKKGLRAGQGHDREPSHRETLREVLFAAGARGRSPRNCWLLRFTNAHSKNQFIIVSPEDPRDWTRTKYLTFLIVHVAKVVLVGGPGHTQQWFLWEGMKNPGENESEWLKPFDWLC